MRLAKVCLKRKNVLACKHLGEREKKRKRKRERAREIVCEREYTKSQGHESIHVLRFVSREKKLKATFPLNSKHFLEKIFERY